MAPAADRLAALSDSQRRELEALLLDFDQSWESKALADRGLELTSGDQHFRRVALLELVKIDLERQWKSGYRRSVEDYLERFSELGTQETVDPELLQVEYEVRRQIGVSAPLRDFQLRFPRRFHQLQQLLEQGGTSVSAPGASVDTSQSGNVSDTRVEGVSKLSSLPTELGRYRILKRLGEGGMGSVYLAHDTELDRKVAIKVPKFEGGEDKQLIERFYREARAAAKLQNRHICAVHDVGEIDGVRYISMAYIQGRALSAYTRNERTQPERSVVLVVGRLARALQEAHALGIVHRDLKPANIMIDRKREPVIMDFGLARLERQGDSRLTQSGMVMGTPAYMAPEQVSGEIDRLGPATDIYSLGVILYELLTGRVPFEGSIAAVMGQIMTQEPPKLSEFRPDLEVRLERICLKMMAKRVEDRYASMQEVADALADYLKRPVEQGLAEDDGAGDMSVKEEDQQLEDMFATQYARSSSSAVVRTDANSPAIPALATSVRRKRPWVVAVIAIAVLFPVILGILLSFRTPYGTLKIEVADPNLKVSVDGESLRIEELTEPIRLQAGSHRLGVKLDGAVLPIGDAVNLQMAEYDGGHRLELNLDGATLTSESFTIVKDDQRVMTVSLVPLSDSTLVGPTTASATQSIADSGPTSGGAAVPEEMGEWATIRPPSAPAPAVAPFDAETANEHQQAWAKYLGVPIEQEIQLPGGETLTMVLIPPGEFMMGSTVEEQQRFLEVAKAVNDQWFIEAIPREVPRHRVQITRPFRLGKHEVTQAQWQTVMSNNPSEFRSPVRPVEHVSWVDIQGLLERLNEDSRSYGLKFVLPSEAQWEYACRAGTTSIWQCGDNEDALRHIAWLRANSSGAPSTVGKLQPNAWGLYDMHGNVWEWCADFLGRKYYVNSPLKDPPGASTGWGHIVRGGCWTYGAAGCRSAFRGASPTEVRTNRLGFRLAAVLADTKATSP